MTLIRLAGVTRTFREGETERVVLRGIDAEIRRGEVVALLGRSGSGKSTLLHLIGGIDLPTAGEIEVAGVSLTRASERARTLFRRHEAYQPRQGDHPLGDTNILQDRLCVAPAVIVDGGGEDLRGEEPAHDDQDEPAGDAVRQQAFHARCTAGVNM